MEVYILSMIKLHHNAEHSITKIELKIIKIQQLVVILFINGQIPENLCIKRVIYKTKTTGPIFFDFLTQCIFSMKKYL